MRRREADFRALKEARAQDFAVLGAVVASRDDAGRYRDEHGAASPVGGGTVVRPRPCRGLFAPPLLATALGAGIGTRWGLKKRHEEKKLGVDLEESLPPGSSAVIVISTTRTWIGSTRR